VAGAASRLPSFLAYDAGLYRNGLPSAAWHESGRISGWSLHEGAILDKSASCRGCGCVRAWAGEWGGVSVDVDLRIHSVNPGMGVPQSASSPMPPRTLVIGLDGADWRVLRPLLDAGVMPHLADLLDTGTSGNLRSPIPTNSAVALA
jgi:type I phosphodiesterase/nucleotide pyrophosphatase